MTELDDTQLKTELDDIMNRIDAILKKVESLENVPTAEGYKTDEVSAPVRSPDLE